MVHASSATANAARNWERLAVKTDRIKPPINADERRSISLNKTHCRKWNEKSKAIGCIYLAGQFSDALDFIGVNLRLAAVKIFRF